MSLQCIISTLHCNGKGFASQLPHILHLNVSDHRKQKEHNRCHVWFENADGEVQRCQKEMHFVFVDLKKVYNRVLLEEQWFCMRKFRGVVRLVPIYMRAV